MYNFFCKIIISRVMVNFIKKTNDFEHFSIFKTLELLWHVLNFINLSEIFFLCFF